jgi:hypothetical protein
MPMADGSSSGNSSTGGNTVPGVAPGHKAAISTVAALSGLVALVNMLL